MEHTRATGLLVGVLLLGVQASAEGLSYEFCHLAQVSVGLEAAKAPERLAPTKDGYGHCSLQSGITDERLGIG